MKPPKTTTQVLDSLSRQDCLQCLAHVQRRQAHDAVVVGLLQARLATLSSNGHAHRDDELLTVKEAAKKLRLRKARVYELVRQTQIPKVEGLGSQVRIPASALTSP